MRRHLSLAFVLVAAPALAQILAGQTPLGIPEYTNTLSASNLSRGFYFEAPIDFVITGVRVPDEAHQGVQAVEVWLMNAAPPDYPITTSSTPVFYAVNVPSDQILGTNISVQQGQWVGFLGGCGGQTVYTSYAANGPLPGHVFGEPVAFRRLVSQTNLFTSGGGQPVAGEPGGQVGRVEVFLQAAPGVATAVEFGDGCGGTGPSSVFEQFDGGNHNDLENGGVELLWTGTSYLAQVGGSGIVAPTTPAIPFLDQETRPFTLPATLSTPVGDIDEIWVCSNGWIALEPTTNADQNEDVGDLLDGPARLCPFWDDFDPAQAGSIHVETVGPVVYVTWLDVTESTTANQSTFQASLDTTTGWIEFNYGSMQVVDGIVGYSPGHGAPNPGDVDLSLLTNPLLLGDDQPDLRLAVDGRPVLGGAATCVLENIRGTATSGVFLVGGVGYPQGISLDVIGALGCSLYGDAELIHLPFTPGGAAERLAFPVNGANQGVRLYVQGAVLDATANGFGVGFSNGIEWLLEAM